VARGMAVAAGLAACMGAAEADEADEAAPVAVALTGTGCAAQAGAVISDSAAAQVNDFLVFMSESIEQYNCPARPCAATPHGRHQPASTGGRRQASGRDVWRRGCMGAQGQ